MAQGVLSALTGGEQTTLATAVTAIKTAADAVIALGYGAKTTYAASTEKEGIFYDKLAQINTLEAQLLLAVTIPAGLTREK